MVAANVHRIGPLLKKQEESDGTGIKPTAERRRPHTRSHGSKAFPPSQEESAYLSRCPIDSGIPPPISSW